MSVTNHLIEARCNMDLQDGDGHAHGVTPLFITVINGHAFVTKQLIEARCDVDLQRNDGGTPVYTAAHQGHASITEQLMGRALRGKSLVSHGIRNGELTTKTCAHCAARAHAELYRDVYRS